MKDSQNGKGHCDENWNRKEKVRKRSEVSLCNQGFGMASSCRRTLNSFIFRQDVYLCFRSCLLRIRGGREGNNNNNKKQTHIFYPNSYTAFTLV